MPHKTGIRLFGVARNPANGFPARLLGGVPIPEGEADVRLRQEPAPESPLGCATGAWRRTRSRLALLLGLGNLLTEESLPAA